MGFFNTDSGSLVRELYVPVPPQAAFNALFSVATEQHRVTDSDDFTLVVNFATGASAWTWGEKVSGQVVPAEGGSTVRLTVVGKVGGSLMQNKRNQELLDNTFREVTNWLRAARL